MKNNTTKPVAASAGIEGLTDERIFNIHDNTDVGESTVLSFARAIEREVLATQSAKQGAQRQAVPHAQAEPLAWMNPETLDVINDARKHAWENDFGMGGKTKAAGYTCRLVASAPQEAKQYAPAAPLQTMDDTTRDEALEEAALEAEKVQDDYNEHQAHRHPHMRDDAATGACACAVAIRAKKSKRAASTDKGADHE